MGDLILQGGGDPYMTLERWWSFVQGLRATGLKSIGGDIVIDNTAFSLGKEDPGAFDGRPNRSYNVLPDALMVNFQSVDFRLFADPESRHVQVIETPRRSIWTWRITSALRRAAAAVPTAGWIFRWPPLNGIGWCFPARCPRIARSAASRACC